MMIKVTDSLTLTQSTNDKLSNKLTRIKLAKKQRMFEIRICLLK